MRRARSRRRCRAASSRTSRATSTPRRCASRSASARRSCRSTSRRWSRSGSSRSRSRCGNTFILKPSEQVPLTQQIAFEVLDGLELPPGVVNLVNGGREIVEGILDHPGHRRRVVRRLGAGGASIVYERAAKAGKRVQALGGAKNHMVVMPDAVIDKTVDGIIGSAFGAAGQRCMAGSVVVTVGDAHERADAGAARGDRGPARRRRPRRGDRGRPGRLVRGARPHRAAGSTAAWPTARTLVVDGRDVDGRDPRARSSARRSSTTSRPTWRSPRRRSSGRSSP